ncbi:MAG TPA: DinB family protein [Vicinamibacterales bacterium]
MSDTHPMLRSVLKSQYHASLAMLRDAIERCPPEEWLSAGHKNAFWQLSYHTLFFAHLYLQRDEAAFSLWEQHRGPDDGVEGEPYTQAQVLEYWEFCDRMVDDAVDALDLERIESGFSWYRMSKLEHQFVNIRHIQHHGAQLIDRVRAAADVGIPWVAARQV